MSSAQDFKCIFCSESFEDKESLQEHFRKHGDPKFNNVTKNRSRFENEQPVGSEKADDHEMVGCDVCDEMFKSISKAITHKHKVHPNHDAKHFCPWCGKLFTMKHSYNKHLQSNHTNVSKVDETSYHCDCCSVDFYLPSAILYHNKFFHRQDTELPAIGHSKKVKTCKQEMMQVYYCPFCGEEYNNKVNLHKHMADDHSDENQTPDEVLRCPLCEAVFYHLDAYEVHLSFHSTEDIYSDDNEMAKGITDFSLEAVPPIMEKVEEETKNVENEEGIDKFLQLIMDDSRESGNNDGYDKAKSKKHKKHKKSKKAAITLDEFLNMNKDVFGDGLDVQGIEEVPTQQVLKKFKGKKNNTVRAVPESAIAKLKKQGIIVKSNSSSNSPDTLKLNKNITVNKATGIVPNRIPVMAAEKPKSVTTSNELLTKLLNQGNSQIKIMKKSTAENFTKEKLCNQTDVEEPSSSHIQQSVSIVDTSSHINNAEVRNGETNFKMEADMCHVQATNKLIDKDLANSGVHLNETDTDDITNLQPQEPDDTVLSNNGNVPTKSIKGNDNDPIIRDPETIKSTMHAPDNLLHNTSRENTPTSDTDNFETNREDTETNASDDEDICNPVQQKSQKIVYNKSLDALKHLSSLITVKPTNSVTEKSDTMENKPMEQINTEETDDNKPLQVARTLGNNVQNFKQTFVPKNKFDTPTKSIDALKTLNKQLTITPCVTSTTSCNDDESEDDEADSQNIYNNLDSSNKYNTNEKDNTNFKTPISLANQTNTTAKPNHLLHAKTPVYVKNTTKIGIKEEDKKKTLNMDILKRLTNVTAKPISIATNDLQVNTNQSTDSQMSAPHKIEKSKQIDQDLEIFNIDDSDSDQESPNGEPDLKQMVNTSTSIDTKTTPSVNMLKNLGKNITVKSTNLHNKSIVNIKKELQSDISKQFSEGVLQNSNNKHNINLSQNKHLKNNLNNTLKKLGNNISIKSQYSSPEPHGFEMGNDDDDIDHNFDMNDEGSDSENTSRVNITEMHDDDEDIPSDIDMEYNENVVVQSPHGSNSENDEETHDYQSDEERNDDIEKQIKTNTLVKENLASTCLDNFRRNNKELTVKCLNDKNALPQASSPLKKQEELSRTINKVSKNMSVKQFRAPERQDEDSEVLSKNVSQSAATSSSNHKITNQVNTVKTVKTFESETIIEEITTTVTKTIRTVNQSSKQVAKNGNNTIYRPRLVVPNQQAKPLQGMTVRNSPTVGTKIRNAVPSTKPTIIPPSKSVGQLVPVRPQNQVMSRPQGAFRPNAPGPSNIKKISQTNVQKPVIGKPLKISPLAINQTLKRTPDNVSSNFSSFKRPKNTMIPSMDPFDDDNDESMVNYSSASSCKSDFSSTATKIVKGKSVVTTQARSEQHTEQHITKLNNMAGLQIVRTGAKQESQVETKNTMCPAKRTTMDAIEKLQKQGLLIKKPRIETPEENEHFDSDSEVGEEDYEENN